MLWMLPMHSKIIDFFFSVNFRHLVLCIYKFVLNAFIYFFHFFSPARVAANE